MKKVILKQFGNEIGHAIVEDSKAQEMSDIYLSNYKGKEERWEIFDESNPLHVEAQILEEKTVVDQEAITGSPAVTHKEVKLKAEYSVEVVDVTSQVQQEKINAEALAYLASTDWMIIREMDSGLPCPQDVKTERAAARAKIVR